MCNMRPLKRGSFMCTNNIVCSGHVFKSTMYYVFQRANLSLDLFVDCIRVYFDVIHMQIEKECSDLLRSFLIIKTCLQHLILVMEKKLVDGKHSLWLLKTPFRPKNAPAKCACSQPPLQFHCHQQCSLWAVRRDRLRDCCTSGGKYLFKWKCRRHHLTRVKATLPPLPDFG